MNSLVNSKANSKLKITILLIISVSIIATTVGIMLLGGIDEARIQSYIEKAGIWSPIIYIVLYTIATLFVLPSTPLNMSGGAIFGFWLGTLWTLIAAVMAAVIAFVFTRTVGREFIANKLAGRWEQIDIEVAQGGLFYIFAIRLQAIIPYAIVNFAAGLTSISFRDYLLGTILGTVPGILPFVMMGSGLQSLQRGNIVPLISALTLTGILIGGSAWYRHRRQSVSQNIQY
ncbi:MAG: TVP38/TMEM64 family protein [Hormoscilla sp. GM7CHS1pb]|nr:TVP38/TMEM64 family protein [Hormoscilla sp. GM7CHS1pb]